MPVKNEWDGRERRENATIELSEEQLDTIAGQAAEKVFERCYTEVGKIAVRTVLLVLGTLTLLGLGWLGVQGHFKIT